MVNFLYYYICYILVRFIIRNVQAEVFTRAHLSNITFAVTVSHVSMYKADVNDLEDDPFATNPHIVWCVPKITIPGVNPRPTF